MLYLNALLGPYNLKIMKTFLKGEREKVEHSIYRLEFVNYIDHIMDNLWNKGILSYNETDSIYFHKVIHVDGKNHFEDLF